MNDQYSGRFMSVGGPRNDDFSTALGRLLRRVCIFAGFALLAALFLVPAVTGLMAWNKLTHGTLPERNAEAERATYVFLDESGREIGVRGPNRKPVAISAVPRHTIQAFLSIEDRRFYDHGGIDPIGIARAALHNYEAGRIVEGGSTITQQLVKNVYLTSEQTLDRKMQEAVYALRLENQRTKAEILEDYLYTVYFGSNAYGIEAAAEVYFGKKATGLSLAESAMLAGLIKAPSNYNPFRREELARERARLVLASMKRDKTITPIQEQLALYDLEQIAFKAKPAEPNGYFLDLAAAQADARGTATYNKLETTLDRPFQMIAENTIREIMTDEMKTSFNVSEAAIVVMRPTGEVLAIVGGTDYGRSQFNRATSAQRQPGSLFKAFVYDAALKKGWRPDDYVVDVPLSLPVPDRKGEFYRPANYDDRYYGLLETKSAFAYSLNSVALRLQEYAGRDQVIATARAAGLDADPAPWPSLALGVFETNLLDITAAYTSLVRNHRVEPTVFKPERRLMPVSPDRINKGLLILMQESVRSGTSRTTQISVPSFGKTGTTQDYRDAWFIGMTDSLIVGVWVGNDDYTPMKKVTGAALPGLIWKTYMEQALPHLALEKNAPTFSTTPLAEIVNPAEVEADEENYISPPRKRILGPARVNADGSLNFYGRTYYLAGIDRGAYQPYTLMADKLPQIANSREMMCEIHRGSAKCQLDGRDLATTIAASGWAPISIDAESDLWYAEQSARDAGKGIWGDAYHYGSWGTYSAAYSIDDPADNRYGASSADKYRPQSSRLIVGEAAASATAIVAEAAAERSEEAVVAGQGAVAGLD
ncbi:transglycosylase domain-containing protein [Aquisalinus flavus]|uniref:Penicillin-binding protein 1A n=1 Tax=Aquisalinus flavus TaxID=1526572 RepID=A0A8J2V5N3_9PROT|nr:transglycosylase domain-containing protein [Aquisalinus flavus]MBD0427836.1 transglycosylase domain-containing protein [Aquisalinus flavus]UNE47603.1 penicillin-binding protein [Aquisalinus flavus]GGD04217.1 penicillin-binding protein 1A [Aquisalinus flavus]